MTFSKRMILDLDGFSFEFSTLGAWAHLKGCGSFQVLLEFVDPRTDMLVKDFFTFYPKPQFHLTGCALITDYNGMLLRIPSDMEWYADNQKTEMLSITQNVTCLYEGEFKDFQIELRVFPIINCKKVA